MANRTKAEVEMENKILRKILFPCEACRGTGSMDDLEPGDISGNTWDCPACGGFNANQARRELEEANG
jgi:hypothetical protein